MTTAAHNTSRAGAGRILYHQPPETCENRRGRSELLSLAQEELSVLETEADRIRQSIAGDEVFYSVNRHIEPTNICNLGCTFCNFAKNVPGENGGFRYTVEDILKRTEGDEERGITEYHIVGGVDPALNLPYYIELVSRLRQAHPDIAIKTLSAVEIGALAKRNRLSFEDVLVQLRDAGSCALTGGGAEIFAPEIRKQIAGTKITGDEWLEIHRTAHRIGLYSNCTILFGHIESWEHRIDHILALRDLHDETGGFRAFIPLPFVPLKGTPMERTPPPTSLEYLRMVAISRIALDNFRTIKAYWPAAGLGVAQLALLFGANDLDGTITEETIYETNRDGLSRSELEEMIRALGRVPLER